jgi:hypothetical protein
VSKPVTAATPPTDNDGKYVVWSQPPSEVPRSGPDDR